MKALYESILTLSAWWWPRFGDHLWQTTLFAAVIFVAIRVLHRSPARRRYQLCLLASAKFLIPAALVILFVERAGLASLPFFQRPADKLLFVTDPASVFTSNYEVTINASAGAPHWAYAVLTAIWLAGVATVASVWLVRRRRFVRSLRTAQNVSEGREWMAMQRARHALGLRREVGLVISERRIEPGVWRCRRPVIVLPASMTTLLDDSELEAIMLHELIHIHRHDNLIGNLQLSLCALLWFHPLVWFISRKLFDEREQACDERVIEICDAPEAYASSILKVVRFCFGWGVAGVAGAASGTNLRRRIENIMEIRNGKRGSAASRWLAVALVSLGVTFFIASGVNSASANLNGVQEIAVVNAELNAPASAPVEPTNATGDGKASKVKPPSTPPPPAEPPVPTPAEHVEAAAPAAAPAPPTPAAPATPAAAPEPARDKQTQNKSTTKKGALIEAPPPVYPDEVKKQQIQGRVFVTITIDGDGNVIYAKARKGPEALYPVSEAAALKARFEPTLVDGNPVKVSGVLTYNFVLDNKK